jgi:hypothetical protein
MRYTASAPDQPETMRPETAFWGEVRSRKALLVPARARLFRRQRVDTVDALGQGVGEVVLAGSLERTREPEPKLGPSRAESHVGLAVAIGRREHGVDHPEYVARMPRPLLVCLLHDRAVLGLRQEALSCALADLGGPRGLGLGTAEPDKLSVAARDLRVCRFLRRLAESTGGARSR